MKNDLLTKNINTNIYFYITLIICVFFISSFTKINFYLTLLSFIITSFIGYIVHVFSHILDFNKLLDIDHNFVQNRFFVEPYKYFIKMIEFHTVTHHNSDINKTPKSIIKEMCNNLFFQGFGLYGIVYFMKKLDINIFLVWAVLYTTIHLVNYNITTPEEHINHHKDPKTNFGIDIYDILFKTKNKNDKSVENYNHYSINLIIITIFYFIIYKIINLVNI